VTECGLGDRMRVEFPEKQIMGTCGLCPYMKKNSLANILEVLQNPKEEQVITIPAGIQKKAAAAVEKMLEMGKQMD